MKVMPISDLPEIKKFHLFFDLLEKRWRIMKIELGHNSVKYLVTDANIFIGLDPARFTHWAELLGEP